jgi:hypothetical protein
MDTSASSATTVINVKCWASLRTLTRIPSTARRGFWNKILSEIGTSDSQFGVEHSGHCAKSSISSLIFFRQETQEPLVISQLQLVCHNR